MLEQGQTTQVRSRSAPNLQKVFEKQTVDSYMEQEHVLLDERRNVSEDSAAAPVQTYTAKIARDQVCCGVTAAGDAGRHESSVRCVSRREN